jgi:diguanylate cyclase (GGDEF)-like protein
VELRRFGPAGRFFLPPALVLQWFSGNIGYHHIHHLSPRIPNYQLDKAHDNSPSFRNGRARSTFWFMVLYNYLLVGAGVVVLLRAMPRFSPHQRRQARAILFGLMPPWLVSLAYMAGIHTASGLDITPFSYAVSGLIYAWSVLRLRLFDNVNLAREAVLGSIRDGYLVFDRDGRLFDANANARAWLGLIAWAAVGYAGRCAAGGMARAAGPGPKHTNRPDRSDPPLHAAGYAGSHHVSVVRGRAAHLRSDPAAAGCHRAQTGGRKPARVGTGIPPDGGNLTGGDRRSRPGRAGDVFLTEGTGDLCCPYPEQYQNRSIMDWVHPDDQAAALFHMAEIRTTGVSSAPVEFRLVRSNGKVFWGEVTAGLVVDENGERRGAVIITSDVNERKMLELRVQRSLEQQRFINELLKILFHPPDMSEAPRAALDRIARFTGARRVSLCEDRVGQGAVLVSQSRCRDGDWPGDLMIAYSRVPSWLRWIESHAVVMVSVTDETIPVDLAAFLRARSVSVLAGFPIYTQGGVYGFLILEDSTTQASWNAEDLELLKNACEILSSALAQKKIEEAERRQREMAEALRDTAGALNSTLELDEVLNRLLDNLGRVVPHHSASIALVEDEKVVRFVRWRGYRPQVNERMAKCTLLMEDFQTFLEMLERRQPLVIDDCFTDPRWVVWPDYADLRSYLGVPIFNKGRPVGFINLDSTIPHFFNHEQAEILSVFADEAAVAIENARLYESARRRAEEMSTLYRVGLTLTAGLDMEQVLKGLMEDCQSVLPADVFYVALYNADLHTVTFPLFYECGSYYQVEPMNLGEVSSLSGIIIDTRKTLHVPDLYEPRIMDEYPVVIRAGDPTRAYVGVPLLVRDQVVGLISMQSQQPNAFTEEQVRLLETIATQAAVAVENARIFDQMKEMAITDAVTQLYSRRHFTTQVQAEVERSNRHGSALSILMVDIDKFKRVNDTWGHNAGDVVLRSVAHVCKDSLRLNDLVGRWGGEEFAVALPETGLREAEVVAERLRRAVDEMTVPVGSDMARVTVSVGVACLNAETSTLEALVDSADRALYNAKQAGRNRVCTLENSAVIE